MANRDQLRIEAALDVLLASSLTGLERDLVEAWSRAWDALRPEVEAALLALAAENVGGRVSRGALLRDARMQAALEAVYGSLDDLATRAPGLAGTILTGTVAAAADGQRDIIRAGLNGALRAELRSDVVGADPRQVAAILERTTQVITSRSRALAAEAQASIRQQIVRGVVVGENPRRAASLAVRGIEDQWDGGLARARTIARTEMIDAHRTAAQRAEQANADVLAGWEWLTHGDERTCRACIAEHGQLHPLDEPGPLGHPNCVLPGAVVSGPAALASATRWFDGEVVDIETGHGRVLAVTPNHPVLTPDGWVPAGQIREGDDVIARSGAYRPPFTGSPDDHQVPSLIEDVAETLGGSLPVSSVRMPTAPEDFHGDGFGSQVHVVRTHGLLSSHVESAGAEVSSEGSFMVGDSDLASFSRGGSLGEVTHRPGHSSDGGLGGGGIGRVLLGGPSGHHEPVGFGDSSARHTCGIESSVNGAPGDPEGLGDGLDGFPTEVPLDDDVRAFVGETERDRVVAVRRRDYSGHVYNLQTSVGWYVANDILTHNCRCARVPVTKSWEDLGFTGMRDPKSRTGTAEELVESMSEDELRAALGSDGYAAWKAGDYPISEWSRRKSVQGWRDSMVPTRPPR